MDYVTSVELFIDLKPRICEVCLYILYFRIQEIKYVKIFTSSFLLWNWAKTSNQADSRQVFSEIGGILCRKIDTKLFLRNVRNLKLSKALILLQNWKISMIRFDFVTRLCHFENISNLKLPFVSLTSSSIRSRN